MTTAAAASLQVPDAPLDISFPFGAQPDIIRANQKDVYYQTILQEQMSQVAQQFFGTRVQHVWQKEIDTISDFCYYGLTTLLGTQTLGEEYCDIVQVNQYTSTFPKLMHRFALVFTQVLLPYIYTRGAAHLKKQTRMQQRSSSVELDKQQPPSLLQTTATFLKLHLAQIQDFFTKNVRPVHLAIFYFFGAYYSFSKRCIGIRYIFTRQLGPNEQRAGYEILGILITLQLLIQGGLTIRKKLAAAKLVEQEKIKQQKEEEEQMVSLTEKDSVPKEKEIVEEDDFDFMDSIAQDNNASNSSDTDEEELTYEQQQTMKCALCLEQRTDTTATPCGHLFCWTCVVEWCQNKPECPLCRSNVNISHLVPLNNF